MPIVLALATILAAPDAPNPRRPVVVTTDSGTDADDQWALAHLALAPEVDLKGVVTTHAPNLAAPAAETAARSARAILDKFGVDPKLPVLAGSSRQLADPPKALPNAGVDFLLESSRGYRLDARLTVVVIGPATDVASALLVDPSMADRIAVVAMAFHGWPDGGDPWNVKNDVRAWRILLESRTPIINGDDAVCRRKLMLSISQARALLGEPGRPLVALLEGRSADWAIWDEVVVAAILGYAKIERRPRPSLRDDATFDHARPVGTIDWIVDVDADRVWADLAANLSRRR